MSENVIQCFGVLYREFVDYTNEYLSDNDISFSESIIIANIGANDHITQEEISIKLSIDRAAIARNVKSLEQKDYIITTKSATDKRKKDLNLTAKGQELFNLISAKNQERLETLFRNVSTDDREAFQRICSLLIGNLKRA